MVSFVKSVFSKITRGYRSMSIQMVISISFTIVTVLGMLFMGMALFWRFSAATEHMSEENGQRLLSQANMHLDSYLRHMMQVSDTLYYRSIKNTDFAEESILEDMALLYEENRDSVVSIAVFEEDGALVAATPLASVRQGKNPCQTQWFVSAMDTMENFHFSTPHVQHLFEDPDYHYKWVVSLSRQVELTRGGVTESGVLLVDMSFHGIEQICRDIEIYNGGYLYLIDSSGEIIYHPQQQLIYAGIAKENNIAAARYKDGVSEEQFLGSRRQVIVKTVGYTGWKLVAVVPRGSVETNAQQLLVFGVFLLLFSAFLLAFLNFRISAYISDPIRRLEQSVKALERGIQDTAIAQDGCYEVQQLSHSIESMVSTMQHLMEDIIVQESQKRQSELEVLQSQINPHFLYNTLDSVIWMTEAGRYEEAIQMVSSLARFFRISLSKGKSIIPLMDELDHARHYMSIQQVRYKNRFVTEITAEDGMNGLFCLKLIVQPLLENAIYHGVCAGVDDGVISVHAYREGEDVLIDVADNGIGMPPETAEQLLSRSKPQVGSERGSGIGVRNVHERIRLAFGQDYGLQIFSEPDEGTVVRIRIPALTSPAAERRAFGE